MALSRADHKKIASSIATEIQRAIRDANGGRLLEKHKARMAGPMEDHAEPDADEMDALMADNDVDDKGEPDPVDTEGPPLDALKKKHGFGKKMPGLHGMKHGSPFPKR